ncbi:MAG TPA: hypothetical protein VFU60_00350 [Ktedonobacterales bacterium]|nr:hypothetical protein [Ktedonobacterales bacterium]
MRVHPIVQAARRLARAPWRPRGRGMRTRALSMFLPVTLLSALALTMLAGCGFHPGGDQIAYLRGDQLWVANPDGSDPRQLTPRQTVSLAWSPDHHELVFRYGSGAGEIPPAGATWAPAEGVSELGVTSISGGSPLQITPTASGANSLARSDAWWDPQGNRLLYREYTPGAGGIAAVYFESQNDQPVGIARKPVIAAATLPTLSPDGAQVAVIDPNGALRLGPAAQPGTIIAQDALIQPGAAGQNLPARLLWQPGHNALVYPSHGQNGVALNLLDLTTHKSRTLTVAMTLRDAAFSPDGALLLLDQSSYFSVISANGQSAHITIPKSDPLTQAFWSPDGRWLLLEDRSGARLIRTSDWRVAGTLAYASPLAGPTLSDTTLWRPAASSPWSGDSAAFTFASGPATWQGRSLPTPASGATVGLYTQQVSDNEASGAPTLIASGAISAPGWSYPDPSTTLLMATA